MPGITSKVDVTNNFPRITREVSELARNAVADAAVVGAEAAASIASQRSKTGRMADIKASRSHGTPDGWGASFVSLVFYAWFQEYGTLGNRRKALKRPASGKRTHDPGTGVEPLGFLAAGRRAGRAAMLQRIKAGLPR